MKTWRPIPSLPEYLASNDGEVMRIPYLTRMWTGGVRVYGGQPRLGSWDAKEGRYNIQFNGKTHRVARLICEAFHGPAPFPGAVVMHLDEDASNNKPTNLRWGTQKQNLNAPGFIAYCQSRRGADSPFRKGRTNAHAQQ